MPESYGENEAPQLSIFSTSHEARAKRVQRAVMSDAALKKPDVKRVLQCRERARFFFGRTRRPRASQAVACAAAMLGALLELVQPHCITPLVTCKQRASFGIDCKQLGRADARSRS